MSGTSTGPNCGQATGLSVASLVLDRSAYGLERSQRRAEMMPLRAARRFALGKSVVLEFENPLTLLYQVQEMVYAENIADPGAAADEVAAYTRLLPDPLSLTATMLVELQNPDTVRQELARLTGLQHSLLISVGGHAARGEEIPGPDEDGVSAHTHSVHFVRFRFTADGRDAFRDPALEATLRSDHAAYQNATAIEGDPRKLLIADLNRV